MKRTSFLSFLFLLFSFGIQAQGPSEPAKTSSPVKSPSDNEAVVIARATLTAHGGDKLKKLTSIVMKGSVEVNAFGQSLPGAFSTAISGDKYFFEIVSPAQNLKQVYNGRETFSSINGFSLPPVTSLGFPLLPRIGDAGYVIAALDAKKKQRGFRITTPEGYYTDFIIDEKTSQIKGYESAYDVGGRVVTTSVEVKAFEIVDGITVPKNYSQRFDLGAMTAYASFKTKTIQINTPIEDAAFSLR